MGIAREHVHQAAVEQSPRASLRAAPDPAVDRRGGDLDEHAPFDEPRKPLGVRLYLGIPLRMRQNRVDPPRA